MTHNSQFFGIRPSTNLQFAQLFERPAKPTADTACRVMHAPRVKAETRPKSGTSIRHKDFEIPTENFRSFNI